MLIISAVYGNMVDEQIGSSSTALKTGATNREIVETFGLNKTGMIKSNILESRAQALHDFYSLYEKLHHECSEPFEGIRDLIAALQARCSAKGIRY